ncbi:hypothetical protein U1Q18_050229, partial [Sarracenia purpurea var. burkii]
EPKGKKPELRPESMEKVHRSKPEICIEIAPDCIEVDIEYWVRYIGNYYSCNLGWACIETESRLGNRLLDCIGRFVGYCWMGWPEQLELRELEVLEVLGCGLPSL